MYSHPSPSRLPERQTLRVKEAAATSGVCRTKLYGMIATGELKSVKVGRARLILRESLDQLLTPSAA